MQEAVATSAHIPYYIISGILPQTDSASSVKLILIEAVNRIIRNVKPAVIRHFGEKKIIMILYVLLHRSYITVASYTKNNPSPE